MRSIRGAIAAAVLAAAFPATAEPPAPIPATAGAAVSSSNVSLVATFPDITAIGARLRGDYLYVTTVAGLRIYNVALTGLPVLQGVLPIPHWENEDVDTNGQILLIAADHLVGAFVEDVNMLYVVDVSIPQAPTLLSRISVPMAHTATCILGCSFAWLGGGSSLGVVDLRNPSNPRFLGLASGSAGIVHDVQVDPKGIAWVSGTGGLSGLVPSVTEPLEPALLARSNQFDNDFIIHNSSRPKASAWKPATSWGGAIAPAEVLFVTEEDYQAGTNGNCKNDGTFQTGYYRQVGSTKKVQPLDQWHLGQGTSTDLNASVKGNVHAFCSSHYFDVRADVAAVAWYEQGVRFVSVKDPRNIRQVGFWRPWEGATWAAYYVGDYVYVIDLVRGLDVIYFSGSSSSPTTKAAPNQTLPISRPDPTFGWICRIPGVA